MSDPRKKKAIPRSDGPVFLNSDEYFILNMIGWFFQWVGLKWMVLVVSLAGLVLSYIYTDSRTLTLTCGLVFLAAGLWILNSNKADHEE